jgi:hypothetical protein
MDKEVKEYINTCSVCARVKAPRQRPFGELQLLPRLERPWQQVTMDFITGLPPVRRNGVVYDAIVVVVDRFTKMARYIPTTTTLKAAELADIFVNEIVRFFRFPQGIVLDRGSLFTS